MITETHHYTQHEWDILMKLAETCKKDNLNDFRKYVEQFHQLSLELWKGGAKSMSFNHSLGTSRHLEAEPPDMNKILKQICCEQWVFKQNKQIQSRYAPTGFVFLSSQTYIMDKRTVLSQQY
ncbi:hypothetical protein [Shimazuella alba]|uniref:Uncharacterized protein n=1 Tax=Shimazuella alba TaxID=2690964 RepID=A0A6I4VNW6_9BACL|nr:hypothetical protein [Shimazuella alba]MXQ53279.1 hypothetical protein [Shimazuella alba]